MACEGCWRIIMTIKLCQFFSGLPVWGLMPIWDAIRQIQRGTPLFLYPDVCLQVLGTTVYVKKTLRKPCVAPVEEVLSLKKTQVLSLESHCVCWGWRLHNLWILRNRDVSVPDIYSPILIPAWGWQLRAAVPDTNIADLYHRQNCHCLNCIVGVACARFWKGRRLHSASNLILFKWSINCESDNNIEVQVCTKSH